ncbi:hypothetical protein EVAR_69217_1 [Eumeta japonica]|uniref:Uncharacterized protein n=1 Tax=Eumeta variegata TaxID=151549 RepID=A0A4C1SNT5_EUMVA|nr:hypothetical protein EVAR_69217_1 [Eumeta japonica]
MEEQPQPLNDSSLQRVYKPCKPTAETLQLLNKQNRTIFSKLFIENGHVDTLKELSTIALSRHFGPTPPPLVAENPILLQIYYDALNVNLPLEKCCHITEERYWKRVVLAKHHDKRLSIKYDVNWKNLGVSLKFVELVEQCPVEYWPEDDMKELALKIKEFVIELHIKRLQPLRERYFQKYFFTDSEESSTAESSYEKDMLSIKAESETSQDLVVKRESQLNFESELELPKAQHQDLKKAKQKSHERKSENNNVKS